METTKKKKNWDLFGVGTAQKKIWDLFGVENFGCLEKKIPKWGKKKKKVDSQNIPGILNGIFLAVVKNIPK